ncbi:hypothetical protein ES702_03884 [subsurface metagenome]
MILKHKILLAFILVCCAICLANGAEQQETLGNFANPSAVKEVLSGKRTVANAAWWGFNTTDSTEAIQGAINSGASKVIIPYVGKDWVVRPIELVSNQEIVFEPGVVVVAKKGEFKEKRVRLFSALRVSNITLRGYGATLRMRKADYQSSKYVKSEWRHALAIWGSSNVNVLGLRLESSGGDGISVGEKGDVVSKNVLIRDCICDDNHRQGISVTSVDKLRIENCVLSNTKGTQPQAGILLEPDTSKGMLVNVVISNCISENNVGHGFVTTLSNLDETSREVSILFVDCYARNCYAPGLALFATKSKSRPKGLVEFRNCVCEDIVSTGAYSYLKVNSPIKLRFSNCKFRNVATHRDRIPIVMKLKKANDISQVGAVEFNNCYVYDEKNRPFLRVPDDEPGEGRYNIKGNFNVYNPYGARIDSGKTDKKLNIKVNYFKTYK